MDLVGNHSYGIGVMSGSATPQAAFGHPSNHPLTLTLEQATNLRFYFQDNNIGDNQGGLSWQIDRVADLSEPTSLMVVAVASAAMLWARRRKAAGDIA
jgi:hypothetical protein